MVRPFDYEKGVRSFDYEDASSVPLTAPAPVGWSCGEFERKVVQRLAAIAVFTGIVGVPAAIYVGVGLAAFLVTAISRG